MIAVSQAARYLPETHLSLTKASLQQMLARNASVYLKPSGGSIGHGMLRIDTSDDGYHVSVLKNGETRGFQATDMEGVWDLVRTHRLSGPYVIQSAKELLRWQGRPCDFRVLLHKRKNSWTVVGIGVRVAGEGVITTHVPNGGSIVGAVDVLDGQFGTRATEVEQELRHSALVAALAIDRHYQGELGEMSMDMAIENSGRIWFLEANSKPMKFDEKPIRRKSLTGVIHHLEELERESDAIHLTHSPR